MYFTDEIFKHILSYLIKPDSFFADGSVHYISYLDVTGHPWIDMIEIIRVTRRVRGSYVNRFIDMLYAIDRTVEYKISTLATNPHNMTQSLCTVQRSANVYICRTHGMERFVLHRSWELSGNENPIWLYSRHTQDRSRAFSILLSRLEQDQDMFENILEFCQIAQIFVRCSEQCK